VVAQSLALFERLTETPVHAGNGHAALVP